MLRLCAGQPAKIRCPVRSACRRQIRYGYSSTFPHDMCARASLFAGLALSFLGTMAAAPNNKKQTTEEATKEQLAAWHITGVGGFDVAPSGGPFCSVEFKPDSLLALFSSDDSKKANRQLHLQCLLGAPRSGVVAALKVARARLAAADCRGACSFIHCVVGAGPNVRRRHPEGDARERQRPLPAVGARLRGRYRALARAARRDGVAGVGRLGRAVVAVRRRGRAVPHQGRRGLARVCD